METKHLFLFCCLLGVGSAWTQPSTCYLKQTTSSAGVEGELKEIKELLGGTQGTLEAMRDTLSSMATSFSQLIDVLSQESTTDGTSSPQTTAAPTESTTQQPAEPTTDSTTHEPTTAQPTQPATQSTTQPTTQPTTVPTAATPSATCGGPGWTQVAYLNMSDPSETCPEGFMESTTYPIRTCGRIHTGQWGCSSATFPVNGIEYSQICGRVIAYRFGTAFAFYSYHNRNLDINSYYVDGLSLTYGDPRNHIWTFASGLQHSPGTNTDNPHFCPCVEGNSYQSPTYVGDNYFCDVAGGELTGFTFIADDPLWDGTGCEGTDNLCCMFNNPPWFSRDLGATISDDLELRMCFWDAEWRADVAISLVEFYVN